MASGAAFALVGGHAKAQTVLFSDNFNRSDSLNLSASATGQSGTLAPLTYNEAYQGTPANDSTLQISGNTLLKGNTGQMGIWALNHNFTDSSILSAGGFDVSLDVVAIGSTTSTPQDRYCGFGVGLTPAEISAFNDENLTSLGPRGSISGGTTGVADFYVDLSLNNYVQVFAGGSLVNQFLVTPGTSGDLGTLEANFSLADFNQGSTVNYTVLFQGVQVTTGSFQWGNTDNNYIVGSMRGPTVTADNLMIATPVPEPSMVALILCGAAGLVLLQRRS